MEEATVVEGERRVVVVGASTWKLGEAVRVLDEAGYPTTGALDRAQARAAIEAGDRLFALVLGGAVDAPLEQELRAIAEPRGAAVFRTAIGHDDPAEHVRRQVLRRLEDLRQR